MSNWPSFQPLVQLSKPSTCLDLLQHWCFPRCSEQPFGCLCVCMCQGRATQTTQTFDTQFEDAKDIMADLSPPPSRFSNDTGATKGAVTTFFTGMAFRLKAILVSITFDALFFASFADFLLCASRTNRHVNHKVAHQCAHRKFLAPLISVENIQDKCACIIYLQLCRVVSDWLDLWVLNLDGTHMVPGVLAASFKSHIQA